MSIRTRISIFFLIIVGLASWFLLRTEINEIKRRYREATEEPLVDFATVLASVVAFDSGDKVSLNDKLKDSLLKTSWQAPKAQIYELNKSSADIRIYITDRSGIVLFDSDNGRDLGKDYSQWQDVNRTLRGEYGARMSYEPKGTSTGMMYVAAPIIKNSIIIGALTVGKATTSSNLFIAAAKKSTVFIGLATFLSLLIIGVLLTFYVTRPIVLLTQYVRRSSEGHKDPLPKLPSNELAMLGKEFQEMRAALDGRKYIENYVQTLTHEIKSPLSGIRAAAEILSEEPPEEDRKRFLANITRESARIENLVHNLLSLASLQSRPGLEDKESISLEDLVSEVALNFSAPCQAKNIELVFEVEAGTRITGDRFWIAQALSHVLHNAIEFSANDTKIAISTKTEKEKINIKIQDHGAGIPDFAKDKVLNKFFSLPRPGSNKKSSGLGLALVSEIMKLHQGEILIESQEGKGTCVQLIFPS
jgi:two-component system sensor histidine kinase CreC